MFAKIRKRLSDWLKLDQPVSPWQGSETYDISLMAKEAFAIEFQDDNKTTYEFVVSTLIHCLNVNANTAFNMAIELDRSGKLTVGRMTKPVAIALADHIEKEARIRNFPTKTIVRKLTESNNTA